MRDWYGDPGVGGYTDSFNFLDLGTGWKHSEPTKSNDTDEIHLCLAFIAGDERIKLIYCDGAPAYKSACKRMQILSEKAQPGIHQTNARIERCNADILAGSRVLLVQAGLPSCFWPYVTACYCFLENVTEVDCESSPWFLRHGAHFMGLALPPGCRVFFFPAPTKYKPSKADARLQCGIFLGYRLAPGGRWNGEYIVADLDDFVSKPLHSDARHTDFHIYPHITKQVKLDSKGIVSPLKEAYDKANFTLEGRSTAITNVDPLLAPDEADDSMNSDSGTTLNDVCAEGGNDKEKLQVYFRIDPGAAMCSMSQKGGPSNSQVVLRITRDAYTNDELERLEHPMTNPYNERYGPIPGGPRDVTTELYYWAMEEDKNVASFTPAALDKLGAWPGWDILDRGDVVLVAHQAQTFRTPETKYKSDFYPSRSTFVKLGSEWKTLEDRLKYRELVEGSAPLPVRPADVLVTIFHRGSTKPTRVAKEKMTKELLSAPDDKSPHGYYVDGLNRRYPLNEFGERVRRSLKPPWVPSEEWQNASKTKKSQWILEDMEKQKRAKVSADTGARPSGSNAEPVLMSARGRRHCHPWPVLIMAHGPQRTLTKPASSPPQRWQNQTSCGTTSVISLTIIWLTTIAMQTRRQRRQHTQLLSPSSTHRKSLIGNSRK